MIEHSYSGTRAAYKNIIFLTQIPLLLLAFLSSGYLSAQNYLTNGIGEYLEFNESTLIVKLELESPAIEAIEAVAVDTNKKLSIRVLKDKTPRAWSRIWIQNLSINNPPDTIKTQTNDLIAMTQAFKGSLVTGDLVEFERVADDLTILTIDGVEIADFVTPGFFEFLLSAFIGSIPPSSELKAELLAGGDFNSESQILFDSMGYSDERPRRLARWAKPQPEPAPAPEPETSVEEETATEVAAAEEVVEDVAEEVVEEDVVEEEVAEQVVEEVAEEVADAEEVVEEEFVEEDDAPVMIIAESLLAAQNYQRAVLTKVYQNLKYPSSAQRRNREGSLRLSIGISENGRLADIEIVQNAKYASFDKAAISAVQKAAPFDPLPLGTLEIPMILEIPIAFKLQ